MEKNAYENVVFGPLQVAYPWLHEPRPAKDPGKPPKYEAVLVWPKSDTATTDKMRKMRDAAFAAKNGDSVKVTKDKQPIKDGDEPADEEGSGPGKFPGMMYCRVSAKQTNPPTLMRADKSPLLPTDFKSGDFAIVSLKAWAYDYQGKGVAFDILGLMRTKTGTPIGTTTDNRKDVLDAFAAVDMSKVETDTPGDLDDNEAF